MDEIQTVTKEHGDCLRQLHLGEHGLPTVLVGTGLADSAGKMQQAMSLRLTDGNLRTLAALPPEEAQSCVRQMFDCCRVNYTAGQLEQIVGEIAKRSEGWPQHVRTETAALFGELDKTQGDQGSVDDAAVKQRADNHRKNSCRARQSEKIGDSILLVGALMKETPPDGWRKLAARRFLGNIIKAEKEGWDLPKGMNTKDFLNHLIHQGILKPDENDMLSFPIPSLQAWLIKRAESAAAHFERCQKQINAGRNALETAVEKAPEKSNPDRKLRAARSKTPMPDGRIGIRPRLPRIRRRRFSLPHPLE